MLEHVEDPEAFYQELTRVGKEVKIVLPPVWDIAAILNILEHKRIFLIWSKEHSTIPPYVELPFSSFVHNKLGQVINC